MGNSFAFGIVFAKRDDKHRRDQLRWQAASSACNRNGSGEQASALPRFDAGARADQGIGLSRLLRFFPTACMYTNMISECRFRDALT